MARYNLYPSINAEFIDDLISHWDHPPLMFLSSWTQIQLWHVTHIPFLVNSLIDSFLFREHFTRSFQFNKRVQRRESTVAWESAIKIYSWHCPSFRVLSRSGLGTWYLLRMPYYVGYSLLIRFFHPETWLVYLIPRYELYKYLVNHIWCWTRRPTTKCEFI